VNPALTRRRAVDFCRIAAAQCPPDRGPAPPALPAGSPA